VAHSPSGGIRVGKPHLRQEQPLVHQGIALPRRIGGKDPDLTILDFAQGAAILPRDPHRVLALFHKARLIEPQDPIRLTHLVGHKLMVVPHHLFLIPPHITDEPLQPADGAPLNLEGHWLN
jgi:hypothetical protein